MATTQPDPSQRSPKNATSRWGLPLFLLLLAGFVFVSLTIARLQGAREAARRTQCKNNLVQIGLALYGYHDKFLSFPPVAMYDGQDQPLLSWRVLLLPFLDQNSLYAEFHLDEPWDSPHNLPLSRRMPDIFRCPSENDVRPDKTNYLAVVGEETVFPPGHCVRKTDVRKDLSQTVMVVETGSPTTVPWSKPEDLIFNEEFPTSDRLASPHVGMRNLLVADRTVRQISVNVEENWWRALMTIRGRMPSPDRSD